jgi:hypothetical protein
MRKRLAVLAAAVFALALFASPALAKQQHQRPDGRAGSTIIARD